MSAAAGAIAAWPPEGQEFARRLRALIPETAEETGTGPVTETLKWGEPAFLTEATGAGTTIRIGYRDGAEPRGRIFVHCRTRRVDACRARFGDALRFEGNRAICVPASLQPDTPIRAFIAMALSYHRDKAAPHG